VSDVTSLAVPPGWYPDRNEPNLVRWWDGQQWTDQTHSTAPAAAAFEQPVSAAAFRLQEQNSAVRIASAQEPAVQAAAAQNPIAQMPIEQPVAVPYAVTQQPAALPAVQYPAVQAGLIAPGWYPDNADPGLQRWWDGAQWTTHTASAASPQLYAGAATLDSSPKNALATLALVLSIGSFAGLLVVWLLLLAIPGIVIGIVALRRARMSAPRAGRRGQAIAAIVVGAISLVLSVLMIVAAVIVYQQVHSVAPQTSAQQSTPSSGGITFPSTIDELKQKIATSFARDNSMTVTAVTCDAAASMVSGSAFDCGVRVADGRWTSVRVNIGNPAGSGMAYGLGFDPLVDAGETQLTPEYTVDEIASDMTIDLAQAWSSAVTAVTCDPSASVAQGSTFGCHVGLTDGRSGDVVITMTPPYGYDITVVHLPVGTGGPGSGSNGSGSGGSSGSSDSDPSLNS